MTSHYYQLKTELHRRGITYADIARLLNRSTVYVSWAMSGRSQFGIDECWQIFDLLGESTLMFPYYFPKKGDAKCTGFCF